VITDSVSGQRLSRGTTTQVAVDMATHEMCFASPPVLFKKLGIEQA
jgi:acyl-CoA thioester hydrolase